MKDTSRVLALSLYIPNCDKKGFFKRKQVCRRRNLQKSGFKSAEITPWWLYRLFSCSVSRPVAGEGGSAGASTALAWKSPASTTPEETCSAKSSTAAATATNDKVKRSSSLSLVFLKPANQASTLHDCQIRKKVAQIGLNIRSGVMDCVVFCVLLNGGELEVLLGLKSEDLNFQLSMCEVSWHPASLYP